MAAEESPSQGETYICPHCDQEVVVDPQIAAPWLACPYCGKEFAIAAEETAEDIHGREGELDGLRVRQIATVRRADIRTHSYLVVVTLASAAGSIQCLISAWRAGEWSSGRWAFLLIAVALLACMQLCMRKAAKISRELKKPLLGEPQSPPDFSQLGDGSQQAKDLENL